MARVSTVVVPKPEFDALVDERDRLREDEAHAVQAFKDMEDDRDAWKDGYNRQHLLYDDERRLREQAEAENARLREALRIIAKNGSYSDALLAAEALKETT